ncbi:MAG: hypothetical protein QF819_04635 [Gemmatimonadota bacterium]|jgi:hypothetical protein|nr:hypothetical protein [Gemmatimonadota bacterium]MDP6528330.1 hypothetical protein [Gemmatimonadota bacterium]MDP6802445.1 hypothetical protein [Gemmatimonadota bacterium]MDP7030999.1 hypothetical protein [Gemmatimonadota bacterium]
MPRTRNPRGSSPPLVEAFLRQPLPRHLRELSRFGKVSPPWAPPPPGSGPSEYAEAWSTGYDGGPIRGAFKWLGFEGVEAAMAALPKSFRKRGRVRATPVAGSFLELLEVERVARDLLRKGAALHDIQEVVYHIREVWEDLDRLPPDAWAVEDLLELLTARVNRGKTIEPVPAAAVFLWASSDEPYHARQMERMTRLLAYALREVMPGSHR